MKKSYLYRSSLTPPPRKIKKPKKEKVEKKKEEK